MRYASVWVKMLKWRWGGPSSTKGPIKTDLHSYSVGPGDREDESWKTEGQIVGRVQGDDWWTVDT